MATGPACGHRLGESYLLLDVLCDSLAGRVELHSEDLDRAFKLDTDGDGKVSAEELGARVSEIEDYVAARVKLRSAGVTLPLTFEPAQVFGSRLGDFVEIHFRGPDIPPPNQLDVEYGVLVDRIDAHRGVLLLDTMQALNVENTEEVVSATFDASVAQHNVDLTRAPEAAGSLRANWERLRHIRMGSDRAWLVVGLLLTALCIGYCLRRTSNDRLPLLLAVTGVLLYVGLWLTNTRSAVQPLLVPLPVTANQSYVASFKITTPGTYEVGLQTLSSRDKDLNWQIITPQVRSTLDINWRIQSDETRLAAGDARRSLFTAPHVPTWDQFLGTALGLEHYLSTTQDLLERGLGKFDATAGTNYTIALDWADLPASMADVEPHLFVRHHRRALARDRQRSLVVAVLAIALLFASACVALNRARLARRERASPRH